MTNKKQSKTPLSEADLVTMIIIAPSLLKRLDIFYKPDHQKMLVREFTGWLEGWGKYYKPQWPDGYYIRSENSVKLAEPLVSVTKVEKRTYTFYYSTIISLKDIEIPSIDYWGG